MDKDSCPITCSVTIEWTNSQGSMLKKSNHRTASLRLIRNNFREMFVEVCAEKSNATTKLSLKSISVFNKFMTEGKATIIFKKENCTLFLSNAPTAQLINFLKTIYVKVTGQSEQAGKNLLKEKLLSDKSLGGVQEISPATSTETNKAKEKAINVSRATITTPSPSATRKRKRTDENTSKPPTAKKLYENPTTGQISEEQAKILQTILNGKNVFFTGSAGTGKSFLLKKIIAALPPDVTTATASTGVAACHIGGITLHQFAGIGLGTANLERCYQMASRNAIQWRRTKHLIIDEISMVDGEYFDKIEAVARHIRKNERPFGGIQLILCGDFFQLPPISTKDRKANFCFNSNMWEKCVHYNFELQTVYRQRDPKFISILNNIRIGRVTDEITEILKATAKQKIENNGILATRLCSHVKEAEEINEFQLNELKGEQKIYMAQDSDQGMTTVLNQQLNVPSKLILKVGCQVMLLKNINVSNSLVNGARGIVTKFQGSVPVVQFKSGAPYPAKLEKFHLKTNTGTVLYRKQIPLKLAWAFSIHKSQGLTLDCVEMCLARVFDAGQSYVALSRAQSLQSLRVLDFNTQQVWAHSDVLTFYKKFRRNVQEMEMIRLGGKPKVYIS
ncbi:ATP-dependent DNA helicase PIF1 [Habropoda laboriosa]|uniref:ATP-dependent DNA helicase PIF1 n=1 Tax=Habropoda laboriosa TaxID=597456 RepID=A0A0L7R6X4_9HYME|nr:PREDICTED: ATP-dependent DNA helicase PIF1 [Habropoda laboriosa]KOC66579.1 ATP-dependent DNA helicase PIF1 [Habropoda laboriosa]